MKNHCCPYCTCPRLTRYGKVKKIQRYKCKNCQRTFRETSGTPLFRLHKVDKVEKYLKALRAGMSVRKASAYVGISARTSFLWRHRFLSSLAPKETVDCNKADARLQIITTEYSAKGRKKAPEKWQKDPKTLVVQRSGQLCLYKLDQGNPAKNASEILKKSDIPNYVTVAPHRILHSAICHSGDNKKVHITNIIKEGRNELSKQLLKLDDWMARFRGVASKYLQQYWNWYLTLNNMAGIAKYEELFEERCCSERRLYLFESLKVQ